MDGLYSRDDLRKAQHRALRRFVGRGRDWSFKELASAARLDLQRLHDIAERPDSPDWRRWSDNEMFSLATVLGSELLTEYWRIAGFGAFRLPDPENDRPLRDIATEAVLDAAALTEAAHRDGGADVHHIRTLRDRKAARSAQVDHIVREQTGQREMFAGRSAA